MLLPAGWPLAVAAGRLPPVMPVVVLSRRQLSTSPPSPEMYWNARLGAAGKQCGYWDYDPLRLPRYGQPAGKMGGAMWLWTLRQQTERIKSLRPSLLLNLRLYCYYKH
jgi:hypothetical protein